MTTRSLTMVLNRELNISDGEVLLVRKPKGWTSFDVVNKIRGIFHVAKVGHAGTLDPTATGLLIVCTGRKTKEIERFMGLEKEYDVRMILGARTSSFDCETPIIERHTTDDVREAMVRSVLEGFVGSQVQVPPMWSAAKVGGKRLYKYARKGEEVERKPREVFVRSIAVSSVSIPEVYFTIVCSKGTYVRTLVDEAGKRLGCGAYVMELERTRLGEFHLAEALSIEDLLQLATKKSHQSV